MYLEILSKEHKDLLPTLTLFKKGYYLAGETAITFHIGHRNARDFDLFKEKNIHKKEIYTKLNTIDYKVSFAVYKLSATTRTGELQNYLFSVKI